MKKQIVYSTILLVLVSYFTGCCKDKEECANGTVSVTPFVEKYGSFTCGGNLYEYEYIKKTKSDIESLTDCTFSPPVAFPIDETDFIYIMYSKLSYFSNDTFQTTLYKDTCNKILVYDVSMIQRDSVKVSFYPQGVARSMFCSVDNIPSDYKVEIKYKYVPLAP